ncbi:D-serine ammonia-lyase, partial [Curvivirga aplysinae]|uniref:D-serine ammonia-lyase n=1 Tax=Curvivirga aplysinae TaxID=2529852 RepID=UPI0012BB98B4
LIADLEEEKEFIWFNPKILSQNDASKSISLNHQDIQDAADRLDRFRPYISKVFPQTVRSYGQIESPIIEIKQIKNALANLTGQKLAGRLFMKADSELPISGSIKARGGIYEVLKFAETIAIREGILDLNDSYAKLDDDEFKKTFARYTILVGSTGNLGLSIGIMGAQLGFKVVVHMSAEAKQWKKELLRSKGVSVVEHEGDYGKAVEEGRNSAAADEYSYFIDDENSKDLFLGYSVAGQRLKTQLEEKNIIVDKEHPLFVYLPCGVGGGPGGVAFGLKECFGDNIHCFFAEPTQSACMFLGMYTSLHDSISVQDFGIANKTCADGLAVGRPSGFVGQLMDLLLSGVYTVTDNNLYRYLTLMKDKEDIELEPSALAGLPGIAHILKNGVNYISKYGLEPHMENATHIMWATGGSMVPQEIRDQDYLTGQRLDLDQ